MVMAKKLLHDYRTCPCGHGQNQFIAMKIHFDNDLDFMVMHDQDHGQLVFRPLNAYGHEILAWLSILTI